ncbi:MAG: hypothetical protein SVY15_06250 [Halobacteriota archaeon]|nr:hypothetical protein [Halobacteriota archaeon]
MGRYGREIWIIAAAWRRMKWWQEEGVLDRIFQEVLGVLIELV